jgi:hypothetical protein
MSVGPWETIAECKADAVILHESNPVVRAALDSFESDPVPLAFVVSALFTTYNIQSATVSDRDEAKFQRWLAGPPKA